MCIIKYWEARLSKVGHTNFSAFPLPPEPTLLTAPREHPLLSCIKPLKGGGGVRPSPPSGPSPHCWLWLPRLSKVLSNLSSLHSHLFVYRARCSRNMTFFCSLLLCSLLTLLPLQDTLKIWRLRQALALNRPSSKFLLCHGERALSLSTPMYYLSVKWV